MTTSLIAPIDAVRDLLRPWHEMYQPWARQGIAPHVTLLSPFLSSDRITRGLHRLTADVLRSWPQLVSTLRTGRSRPYHLTVACTEDHQMYDEIRAALDPLLPITMSLNAVQLVAHDDNDVRLLTTIRAEP